MRREPPKFQQVASCKTIRRPASWNAADIHLLLSLFSLRRRRHGNRHKTDNRVITGQSKCCYRFRVSLESFGRVCVCFLREFRSIYFYRYTRSRVATLPAACLESADTLVAPPELAGKSVNRTTVRWDNFGRLGTLKSFLV